MVESHSVNIVTKPQEFFRERVHHATSTLKLEIEDEIEFYLVNLLCGFIDPNKEGAAADVLDRPLAFMFKDALEAPIEKQTSIFKRMGDVSLYIAGYFQDYFNQKTFDISYYIDMGRTAYANLSSLIRERHGDEQFSSVYQTLSFKFPELVEVVAIVSDLPGSATSNDNLLAIYDRWNQTQSERLRRKLADNGIVPVAVTRKAQ